MRLASSLKFLSSLLFLFLSLRTDKDSSVVALAGKANMVNQRISIVTGANGYVGRELVQVLLKDETCKSKKIYCLVRQARVQSESDYWNGKSDCIVVMPYDMTDGGTTIQTVLESASQISNNNDDESTVERCIYHVASVFGPSKDHVQTAKDNVQGNVDLMEVIAKFPNWRLVVTSSMAAVRGSGQEPLNGKYYTHEDWNTLSKLGENWGASYQWSKAESERKSWELAKKYNIPMSSICPSFVFGPPSDGMTSGSYSITLVGQWVRGKSKVQSRLFADIRDVAEAHFAAGTLPQAIGQRYIVSKEERISSEVVAEALKEVCKETGIGNPDKIKFDANFQGGAIPIGAREVAATERLKDELGITLRPHTETMVDMGRSLLVGASQTSDKK